jgi:hypothetical protein
VFAKLFFRARVNGRLTVGVNNVDTQDFTPKISHLAKTPFTQLANQVKQGGYTCAEAKQAGFNPKECMQAGFTYQEGSGPPSLLHVLERYHSRPSSRFSSHEMHSRPYLSDETSWNAGISPRRESNPG